MLSLDTFLLSTLRGCLRLQAAPTYNFVFSISNVSLIGCIKLFIETSSTSWPVPIPAGGSMPHSGIFLVLERVSSSILPHGYSFFCKSSKRCFAHVSGVSAASGSRENCFIFVASNSGVSTAAGQRAVILTPVRGSLVARDFTNPMIACLVAQYRGAARLPPMPARDACDVLTSCLLGPLSN